ncbi:MULTISPECIES: glycosyltransferase [unclassified Duganella]|uniref:glycosyltransferase family 2 protein n=1 Tax=unclassified Duganella TaxID=2636909 RepID=UPI00088B0314|nr:MULTISPECIES: glycosyltransferase [unclassified Duganella]SDH50089.1 Glycosyl transferase family 2 [Duganella sp. OV458]SDK63321.1 Glycosyl transferase family 2 [Duganella sp. OV510]
MPLPLVSIVIPSYKPGHFEQTLKTAIGQTYPRIEILVSDNCPTEEIRDICARYPQVTYQRNTALRDKNVLGAFFSGKGELIKPLFDDDLLHPFCVERMVATMNQEASVQLVFSASQVINIDNERVAPRRPYEVNGSMSGRDLHRSLLLGERNIVGEFSTIMFRRERLWEIGPLRLFHYGQQDCTFGLADVAAYINLAGNDNVFYIDEELSYFRKDKRHESYSNYRHNPDVIRCLSDSIDLLLESYDAGVVTGEEVLSLCARVEGIPAELNEVFPLINVSQQRYRDYLARIGAAASI